MKTKLFVAGLIFCLGVAPAGAASLAARAIAPGPAAPGPDAELVDRSAGLLAAREKISAAERALAETRRTENSLSGELARLANLENAIAAEADLLAEAGAARSAELAAAEKNLAELDAAQKSAAKNAAAWLRALDRIDREPAASGDFSEKWLDRRAGEIFAEIAGRELGQFRRLRDRADADRQKILTQKTEIAGLTAEAERRRAELRMLSSSQKNLLLATKNQEKNYQKLLADARAEQTSIDDELRTLAASKNLSDPILARLDAEAAAEKLSGRTVAAIAPLAWPVDPGAGVTAFFHDENYEEKFKMDHGAVDIRAPQDSAIFAPAPGYVYKIHRPKDPTGYQYILLAHAGGIFTLFGHVSEVEVAEGDLVDRGTEIARSGGLPGTAGAGWMTTGAHLHFEVRKNGEKVDPLEFLPLTEMRPGDVPAALIARLEEQKRLVADGQKVPRVVALGGSAEPAAGTGTAVGGPGF